VLHPQLIKIVWDTVKDHFSPEIVDGLRQFHRSVPNLATLYESVCFYNNKPKKKSSDFNVKLAYLSAMDAFKFEEKVKLTKLSDIKPDDFPHNTSPCLPYIRQGFKTKIEAWDTAMKDAERIKYCISNNLNVRLPAAMVFAKSKICYKWESKTRAIWGKSLCLLMLEAMFVKTSWKEYVKGNTPAAYQVQAYHNKYNNLRDAIFDRMNCSQYIGLDFKKYDTSIPPWLIFMAFSVLEQNIDFTQWSDGSTTNLSEVCRLWNRLKKTVVDTVFLMPDGWMFQKHTGVDSGSFIFQLVENVCTYIMVKAALLNQGVDSSAAYVLGDDSLFWCKNVHSIDFQALCSYILSEFGVQVSHDKSFLVHDLSKVKFLGRYLAGGIPRRDVCDIVLSLLLPGRPDDDVTDLCQRCVSLYYESALTSFAAESFIRAVWERIPPDIRWNLERNTHLAWPKRIVKRFDRLGMAVPVCRLPHIENLFLLAGYRDITVPL